MGKNSGGNSDNQGGQDTHVRTVDNQSEIKVIFDKETEEKINRLTEKCERGAPDKETIQDMKDLMQSVVDKNTPKGRDNEKEGTAKIPLQLTEQDYTNLLNDVKKSRDVNRGNPDQSKQFTKQILNRFITTKAIDRVKSIRAKKLLNTQLNALRRIESGDDKDYAALKTQGIINYLTRGQKGKFFKRIAGKALRGLTQRATGDIKETQRTNIKRQQSGGHGLSGR